MVRFKSHPKLRKKREKIKPFFYKTTQKIQKRLNLGTKKALLGKSQRKDSLGHRSHRGEFLPKKH
jgi:hypothetical protein